MDWIQILEGSHASPKNIHAMLVKMSASSEKKNKIK